MKENKQVRRTGFTLNLLHTRYCSIFLFCLVVSASFLLILSLLTSQIANSSHTIGCDNIDLVTFVSKQRNSTSG